MTSKCIEIANQVINLLGRGTSSLRHKWNIKTKSSILERLPDDMFHMIMGFLGRGEILYMSIVDTTSTQSLGGFKVYIPKDKPYFLYLERNIPYSFGPNPYDETFISPTQLAIQITNDIGITQVYQYSENLYYNDNIQIRSFIADHSSNGPIGGSGRPIVLKQLLSVHNLSEDRLLEYVDNTVSKYIELL